MERKRNAFQQLGHALSVPLSNEEGATTTTTTTTLKGSRRKQKEEEEEREEKRRRPPPPTRIGNEEARRRKTITFVNLPPSADDDWNSGEEEEFGELEQQGQAAQQSAIGNLEPEQLPLVEQLGQQPRPAFLLSESSRADGDDDDDDDDDAQEELCSDEAPYSYSAHMPKCSVEYEAITLPPTDQQQEQQQQLQIADQQGDNRMDRGRPSDGDPATRVRRRPRRFTLNPLIFAKQKEQMRRRSLAQMKLSYYSKGTDGFPDGFSGGTGLCDCIFSILSWLLLLVTFPVSICFCLKVTQEYERAVVFRLGRLIDGGTKGPGIFFILPCIDTYTKVDLRTLSFDVPPQEILTKDSVTVAVDAVVYYRVNNATVSVANVENAHHSTRLLAQTTLRNMLGTKKLSEILSDRDAISNSMQNILDDATDSWGIKVERVEIKDVRLPVQLQRVMAAEAEADREARAKVVAAVGEQKASRALKEAAEMIAQNSAALQLRYLQTLNSISAEKNSTIVLPIPMELIRRLLSTQ